MRCLSAKDRRRAIGRSFEANPRHRDQFSSACIIVVGDVLTNGANADGCIETFRKVGADLVQIVFWDQVVRAGALVEGQPIAIDA